ncbi:MAG: formylmethanofuran dehydrogenase [Hyphomicrobiales bacterium]|nr:formylmethanofuran dehydrogenase [Hyphomicrobiales bacterium]
MPRKAKSSARKSAAAPKAAAPIDIDAACKLAATLLSAARLPVIAGMGADVAGARAAIRLARATHGVYDHLASAEIMAELEPLRRARRFATTPDEARVRADCLLFVGAGLVQRWPEIGARLAVGAPPALQRGRARKIVWLGGDRADVKGLGAEVDALAAARRDMGPLIGMIRARAMGRPIKAEKSALRRIDSLAETFKAAHFGVAISSAAALDPLALEQLAGLVEDLNATTRFSSLLLGPRANGAGVTQAGAWVAGFPPRTGFCSGEAEHDPWRFDARRLIESGEADAALWIDAYGDEPPPWTRKVPLVTLTCGDFGGGLVHVRAGRPGVDHDCVEMAIETGVLTPRAASAPSAAPRVDAIIERIMAHLPGSCA